MFIINLYTFYSLFKFVFIYFFKILGRSLILIKRNLWKENFIALKIMV
jgi:hypothetical protein